MEKDFRPPDKECKDIKAMIKFVQKEYVLPALGAMASRFLATQGGQLVASGVASAAPMAGVSGILGIQANKTAKEQGQEMMEMQKRQMAEQRKMLQKQLEIQQQAVNKGVSPTAEIKTFAINPQTLKNIKGAVKGIIDVSHSNGRNLTKSVVHGLTMGAGMAGAGYIANKAIEKDAKKSGIISDTPESEESKKKRKSNLIKGAAFLGTTAAALYGARKGKLGGTLQNMVSKENVGKLGEYAKESAKDVFSPIKKDAKTGKKSINGSAVFTYGLGAVMPVVGYKTKKKQIEEQAEKTYAIPAGLGKAALKRVGVAAAKYKDPLIKGTKSIGQSIGGFIKAPITKTMNGISKFSGAGIKESKSFLNDIKAKGVKENNPILEKLGGLGKHLNTNEKGRLSLKGKALLGGATVVGSTVMFKPWEMGEKAVKKTLETADKNAYAYEKSQEQEVK